MTNPAQETARLVRLALPLQVAVPTAGQQCPVWHVPDENPARVQSVEELARAAQQWPDLVREQLRAYQRQFAQQHPQQPTQLTWSEGTPQTSLVALDHLVLETQGQG